MCRKWSWLLLAYWSSGITCGKSLLRLQCGCYFESANISNTTSIWFQIDMKRSSQILPVNVLFMVTTSSMTSSGDLTIALYIHVKERLAQGASCKSNISSMNANIVIVFLGYACLTKILINEIFQDHRSNVKVTGLLCDFVPQTAATPQILGVPRWNKNWNVENGYSYMATATKIRFHFRFPRPPHAAFDGHIGWFSKLKV